MKKYLLEFFEKKRDKKRYEVIQQRWEVEKLKEQLRQLKQREETKQ